MSSEDSVTHKCVTGEKPAGYIFSVEWKNWKPENCEFRNDRVSVIVRSNECDWETFRHSLLGLNGASPGDLVTYVDSEDDIIPIESQCEFDEALRIAARRANSSCFPADCFNLVVYQGYKSGMEYPKLKRVGHRVASSGLDDTPPKWFTSYMQRMKDEIVTEVSRRVTRTVFEALRQKKRVQRSDDCCYEKSCNRYRNGKKQQRAKKNLGKRSCSNSKLSWFSSKDISRSHEELSRKPDEYFSRSPRERCQNGSAGKSRVNKCDENSKGSRNVPEVSIIKLRMGNSPTDDERSPIIKDEIFRCSVTGSLDSRTERENEFCGFSDSDESIIVDVSQTSEYRRPMSSSFDMMIDRPYDRVDEINDSRDFVKNDKNDEQMDDQDADRDSSSFELLSEPPSRPVSIRMDGDSTYLTNYNRNVYSDQARVSGSFDVYRIHDNSDIEDLTDLVLVKHTDGSYRLDESNDPRIIAKSDKKAEQMDDQDVNCDSSSFEILSEPPSRGLPIRVDGEDKYFKYLSNSNRNVRSEDSPESVLGSLNRDRIDDNSDIEDIPDIVCVKRTDGSYSFVADELPGSTKINIQEKLSDSIDDDVAKPDESKTERETPNRDEKPRKESNDPFYESTQSFHSHTTGNERKGFSYSSGSPSGARIFVDVNVSKGLGDTRRSNPSPSKPPDNDDNPAEIPVTSKPKTNGFRKPSSARGMGFSPTGDGANKFGPWSTMRNTKMIDEMVFNDVDPLHILPESLVTGAVHVATSALTTARRVYDKILTAQTKKSTDKTKFGRR